jgi:hypothetical protein
LSACSVALTSVSACRECVVGAAHTIEAFSYVLRWHVGAESLQRAVVKAMAANGLWELKVAKRFVPTDASESSDDGDCDAVDSDDDDDGDDDNNEEDDDDNNEEDDDADKRGG